MITDKSSQTHYILFPKKANFALHVNNVGIFFALNIFV